MSLNNDQFKVKIFLNLSGLQPEQDIKIKSRRKLIVLGNYGILEIRL